MVILKTGCIKSTMEVQHVNIIVSIARSTLIALKKVSNKQNV